MDQLEQIPKEKELLFMKITLVLVSRKVKLIHLGSSVAAPVVDLIISYGFKMIYFKNIQIYFEIF